MGLFSRSSPSSPSTKSQRGTRSGGSSSTLRRKGEPHHQPANNNSSSSIWEGMTASSSFYTYAEMDQQANMTTTTTTHSSPRGPSLFRQSDYARHISSLPGPGLNHDGGSNSSSGDESWRAVLRGARDPTRDAVEARRREESEIARHQDLFAAAFLERPMPSGLTVPYDSTTPPSSSNGGSSRHSHLSAALPTSAGTASDPQARDDFQQAFCSTPTHDSAMADISSPDLSVESSGGGGVPSTTLNSRNTTPPTPDYGVDKHATEPSWGEDVLSAVETGRAEEKTPTAQTPDLLQGDFKSGHTERQMMEKIAALQLDSREPSPPPPRRSSMSARRLPAILTDLQSSPRSSNARPPPLISPPRTASSRPAQARAAPTTPEQLRMSPPRSRQTTPRAVAIAAARDRNLKASPPLASTALRRGDSPFERSVSEHATVVLRGILLHLDDYRDVKALRRASRTVKRCLEGDQGRELVLQRFLGPLGYRSFAAPRQAPDSPSDFFAPSAAKRHASEILGATNAGEALTLSLRDLDAFLGGQHLTLEHYSRFAYDHFVDRLHPRHIMLARASTRAWNRVVLRLRAQAVRVAAEEESSGDDVEDERSGSGMGLQPFAFPELAHQRVASPPYKLGRAPCLRVWVPTGHGTGSTWMDDGELVETEREIWRAGAWPELARGDVVNNVAIAAWGNVGKLIFDGKFLRDFSFTYDVVGHLPNWLNALTFSPSFFHNVVASSTTSPVIYLCLNAFIDQVKQTLAVHEDKVRVSSPQGHYLVKRFVYRANITIRPLTIVSTGPALGGSGPGGLDVVHEDWVGDVVLEVEGTVEHSNLLLNRVASHETSPYRILRDRCRPSRLWIRPVLETEAC